MTSACDWCGAPFAPNAIGRPKRYCSVGCRRDAGHYREDLPAWTARLAQLEADASGCKVVPTFLRIELDDLRRAIAAGPAGETAPPGGRPSAVARLLSRNPRAGTRASRRNPPNRIGRF